MNFFKKHVTIYRLAILVICIGILLKFYRVDYKIFWYDEIATVGQILGANDVLEIDTSYLNQIAPISHYNGLLTHSDSGYSLGKEYNAQLHNMNLNPLHYMLLSMWYRIVGDNLMDYRLFSIFIFLLTLPFLYGLTKELFRSKNAGLLAVSLFAISPFIHYFSQEARYYILWAFILVTIHYFLIKAVHYEKNKWWVGYIICAVLALYTSALSAFILFEHALFILFFAKKYRIKFVFVSLIIFLCYSPWFIYVYMHQDEVYQALAWHKFEVVPIWAPLLGLVLGLVRTFSFYLNYTLFWEDVFHNITNAMIYETILNLAILAVMIISVIIMAKKEKRETFGFIIMIIIPGLLFFWGLDLARNAITTHWWRYYIFNTIPVILIVTYIIYYFSEHKKWFSGLLYGVIVCVGIYSIVTISDYKYWYLGGEWEQEFVDNAELLSNEPKPLMITDFIRENSPWEGPTHTMEVLVNCSSDSIDVLRVSPNAKHIDALIPDSTYSSVYVIYASDSLLKNLKQTFGDTMQPLSAKHGPLRWKINVDKKRD